MHLYIPPRSAHPPGVIKGLIAGHIYRAYALCSDERDAMQSVRELWRHLRARGYDRTYLKQLFHESLNIKTNVKPSIKK